MVNKIDKTKINLNVWKYGWLPLTYPSNWLKNIKNFFYCIKWSFQRIIKGYCDIDLFNLDYFYLDLFTKTLEDLSNTACGYPGIGEMDTYEKWVTQLKEMSDYFYKANECNNYYINKYEDRVMGYFDPYDKELLNSEEYNKLQNKWIKKEQANQDLRDIDLEDGLKLFVKYFRNLWD